MEHYFNYTHTNYTDQQTVYYTLKARKVYFNTYMFLFPELFLTDTKSKQICLKYSVCAFRMEEERGPTTLSTTDNVINSAGAEEELSLQVYLFMAFMLPVCAIIVIGNSLVLIAPWKFPKLRMKQHVFLMNVAVADLATGLLATPIILVTELMPQLMSEFFFCVSRMTIAYTCTVASNLLLLASSIERYVAIQHPFLHEKTCSGKTIALSCGVIWVYALAMGMSLSLGWNNWSPDILCFVAHVSPFPLTTLTFCQAFVVMTVIGMLYARIFNTARKQAKRIAEDNMAAGITTQTSKAGLKAAKVTAMVVLAYMICFIPYVTTVYLESIQTHLGPKSPEEVASDFEIPILFTSVLLYVNAATNPIIYHGVMPTFRAAVKSLLGCDRLSRTRVSVIDTQSNNTTNTDI